MRVPDVKLELTAEDSTILWRNMLRADKVNVDCRKFDRRDAQLILGYERAKARVIERWGCECYRDLLRLANRLACEIVS